MPVLKLMVFQFLVPSGHHPLQNDLTYTKGKLKINSTKEAELQHEFDMNYLGGSKFMS